MDTNLAAEPRKKKSGLRWPLRAVAIFLAVVLLASILLNVASAAKLEFDNTASLQDQLATQCLEAGLEYLKLGRYDQAMEYLKAVLNLRPNDPDAQALRGSVYIATGDYANAIQSLSKAIELYGLAAPAKVLLQLASLYVLQGDADDAEPLLRRVTVEAPEESNGWLLLGQIDYDKKDYDEALTCFDTYLKADPENATALAIRAACRSATGDEDGAMKDLVLAASYAKDNPEIRIALAEVYISLGDYAGAAEAYRLAVEADPSNLESRQSLAACQLYTGDYEGAAATCQAAIDRLTDTEKTGQTGQSLSFSLAVANEQLGRFDEAAGLLEALLTQKFEVATVTVQLAACYANLPDQAEKALPLLEKTLTDTTLSAADRAALLNEASSLCLDQKAYAQAIDYADRSLEAVPNGGEALLNRAVANLQNGAPRAAADDFTILLDGQPDLAQVRYYRALAYVQLNRLQEALDDLNRCAQDTDEPEVATAAAELLGQLD